jgi:hypothetical protein
MTRAEYLEAHPVGLLGRSMRLRTLVRRQLYLGRYVDTVIARIQSLKENRIRSTRSLTSEERVALKLQAGRFAELLAALPAPRLP